MTENSALVVSQQTKNTPLQIFGSLEGFEAGQRICKALASSNMVPKSYFNEDGSAKFGDMMLALDMAQRTGASPLMVMQNLQVIEGRPGWSAQFITAAINSSGKFSPLRYIRRDLGKEVVEYETWTGPKGQRSKVMKKVEIQNREVIAWAVDASGERLEGPPVSMKMAVLEGWYGRNTKWQSMPDLMLTYRAAAFFGRTYSPEMLMGLPSADEVLDVDYVDVTPIGDVAAPEIIAPVNEAAPAKRGRKAKAETAAQPAAEVPLRGADPVNAAAATMAAAVAEGLLPPMVDAQRDENDRSESIVNAPPAASHAAESDDEANPFDFVGE